MKSIYVIENENGQVKIGISQNIESRVKTLSRQGGFVVKRSYQTEKCSNHYNLENIIHCYLKDSRKIGEWFDVNYDDAVNLVKSMFSLYAKFEDTKKDFSAMADRFIDKIIELS
ncbi:MAG: Meiotically up-regulated [Anaerocolumna sp.]|jgi:tRNA 2-selenouridine synthase SelU|nr:Meiotically up-regulated [Herbinix sp.]MDF2952114.1 Meiotically up-regulated [Anaerocolumna sp.]